MEENEPLAGKGGGEEEKESERKEKCEITNDAQAQSGRCRQQRRGNGDTRVVVPQNTRGTRPLARIDILGTT